MSGAVGCLASASRGGRHPEFGSRPIAETLLPLETRYFEPDGRFPLQNVVTRWPMSNRRSSLFGVFAVLLALMAQLGAGASVPRLDPIVAAGALCHTDDDTGGAPSPGPAHHTDCPVCPLCAAVHAQGFALVANAPALIRPAVLTVRRTELPPPSTAPPAPHRPPGQPRAPPVVS
jgi:hypothetical protein